MLDDAIAAFPELTGVTPVPVTGGQKEVFRAKHGNDDVALKIIKPSSGADDRADREVAAIEKLKSIATALGTMNTPRILDSGTRRVGGDQRYYIIEQFIDGLNLRQVLTATPILPLHIVLKLAKVLVGACADYESVNMVHRDINPRNIMFDTSEKFWVIDLGLVRHLDMVSITADGPYRGVLGTPGYAPIEVLQNNKGEVNVRADLFSAGVVLHEALTGGNPYVNGARDIFAVFKRVETTDLPRLVISGDTGGEIAEYISTLAQRYPSRRPQTGADAVAWLDPILRRHGV